MKKIIFSLFLILCCAMTAQAIPVLQVGAPGGPGEGTYADYTTVSPDEDTAFTTGSLLKVAGVYQTDRVLNLGGQYGTGLDWSSVVWKQGQGQDPDVFFPTVFDTHGALLVASVPEGQGTAAATSLMANGSLAIFQDDLNSWLPNPPSNHYPAQSGVSDFLFFDIGDFAKNLGVVPDFADETGAADGEIKDITISGMAGLDGIHWDVMALETFIRGQTTVITNDVGNPGSHDVTWMPSDDPPVPPFGTPVPEPSTILLLGGGLVAIGILGRRKIRK